jgi:hypothetical protein
MKIRLSGTENQVFEFFLRHTLGWHRKIVEAPLEKIMQATGLISRSAIRARDGLIEKGIIVCLEKSTRYGKYKFRFVDDSGRWRGVTKMSPNLVNNVASSGTKLSSRSEITDTTKPWDDVRIKDIASLKENKEIKRNNKESKNKKTESNLVTKKNSPSPQKKDFSKNSNKELIFLIEDRQCRERYGKEIEKELKRRGVRI